MVYSNCQCSSAFCLSLTYCSICLGQSCGHLLGKSCPLGFSLLLFSFLCRLNCRCPFPVWCLGQDVEFDCIGNRPDHCLFIYFACHRFHGNMLSTEPVNYQTCKSGCRQAITIVRFTIIICSIESRNPRSTATLHSSRNGINRVEFVLCVSS